ncbi:MAG: LOG family protein [Desulfobulbus propionicus]|nr:MAG: LOG family protein [Desulfobulbus propionicus]
MNDPVVPRAIISPDGSLDILSRLEIDKLLNTSQGELYSLFRSCSLAVLNYGEDIDDGKELLERFSTFDISVIPDNRGVKLELFNAPEEAFVDGELIFGIKEHLFAVLRDIIYVDDEINRNPRFNLASSAGITDAVFYILRNAKVLKLRTSPRLVVCWGGHAISDIEYDYSKEVGYQLGLRGLDICTGCGSGAMKGPMKGAAVGHAKQRIYTGQYIGITEPGIIAAESPNAIVNDLVIMPDIEKRLEAFVRTGHAFIVFPGGVGTTEEILYLLGVLLAPENKHLPFPLVFTGPEKSADYFRQVDAFIGATLGPEAQKKYTIIIDDPVSVAGEVGRGLEHVHKFRQLEDDACFYNWLLHIDYTFQQPFHPTHDKMKALNLHFDQDVNQLAGNLRRAFSGIVAGNVKDSGIRAIEEHGLFELHGDQVIMESMDELLSAFIAANRMKIATTTYSPCYRLIS